MYKGEIVPCEIVRNKLGGVLKQVVADTLYNIAGRPRGPFVLVLPDVEVLKPYGTYETIEGKDKVLVLKPKAVLDKTFFEVCAEASKRDQDIQVYDCPVPAKPQGFNFSLCLSVSSHHCQCRDRSRNRSKKQDCCSIASHVCCRPIIVEPCTGVSSARAISIRAE